VRAAEIIRPTVSDKAIISDFYWRPLSELETPTMSKFLFTYEEVIRNNREARFNDARVSPLIDVMYQAMDDVDYQSWYDSVRSIGHLGTEVIVEKVTSLFETIRNTLSTRLSNLGSRLYRSVVDTFTPISTQLVTLLSIVAVLILAYSTGLMVEFLPIFAMVLTPLFAPQWVSFLTVPLSVAITALKRWKDKVSVVTNVVVTPASSTADVVAHYQALDDTPSAIANFLMKGLVVVLCLSSVSLIPSSKSFDIVTKRLKDIPAAIDGTTKLTAYCEQAFERAKQFYYVEVLGHSGYISATGETEEVRKWSDQVMHYLNIYNRKAIVMNEETANEVSQLYIQALKFQRLYANTPALLRIISPLYGACLSLYTEITQNMILNPGPRQEPALIFFGGDTGTGKSGFMYPFAIDSLRAMKIPVSNGRYENSIYTRCVEQEYWDGYRGQPICLYDDFGQQRDSMSNPNLEFMELIRGGNLFPWALHMAHLQEKATTQFRAKAIFATTNMKSFQCESLISTNAVVRRVDLGYWCSVKAEYQRNPNGRTEIDRSLDPTKVPGDYSLDVYEFRDWNVASGSVGDEVKSFYQVTREIQLKIRRNETKYEKRKAFYEQYANEEFEDAVEYQAPMDWGFKRSQNFDDEVEQWFAQRRANLEEAQRILKFRELPFHNDSMGNYEKYMLTTDATCWYASDILEVLRKLDPIQHRDHVNWRKIWNSPVERDMYPFLKFAHEHLCDDDDCVVCLFDSDVWELIALLMDTVVLSERRDHNTRVVLFHHLFSYIQPYRSKPVWYHPIHHLHPWIGEALEGEECRANCDLFSSEGCECLECLCAHRRRRHQPAMNMDFVRAIRESHLFDNYAVRIDDVDDDRFTMTASYQAPEAVFPEELEARLSPHALTAADLVEMWDNRQTIPVLGGTIEMVQNNERVPLTMLESFISRSYALFATVKEGVQEHFERTGTILLGVSILLGIVTAVATFSDLFSTAKEANYEIGQSGDDKTLRHRYEIGLSGDTRTKAQQRQRLEGVSSEASIAIGHLVQKNRLFLMAQMPDREVPIGQITGIRGTYFLINLHFVKRLETLKQQGCIEVFAIPLFNEAGYRIPIDHLIDIVPVSRYGNTTDVAMGRMPRHVPRFRDLQKHFSRRDELSKISNIPVNLITSFISGKRLLPQVKSGVLWGTKSVRTKQDDRRYVDSYQCDFDSSLGDCGGILIAAHDGINRKIIGLHFAGNDGSRGAFSAPLIWEDFEHLMPDELVNDIQLPAEVDETTCDLQAPNGLFPIEGKLSTPTSAQVKTTLVKSLIHNQIMETTMAPAVLAPPLTPGGPLLKALEKNGAPSALIDHAILADCVNSYAVKMFEGSGLHTRNDHRKVLTFDEAVKGHEMDEFKGGLNRIKSPGYPYEKEVKSGFKGKQQWFGKDDWLLGETTTQVRADVDDLIEAAKTGVVHKVLYRDHQKDEKRDIKTKVALGKTRSFAGAPMHFVIAFRMFFLDFISFMMHNRIENESAVGINAYSSQWHVLARKLQEKGKHVVAGDFSNFDGSLNADFLYACLDMINAFYDDGNDRIRACLWENIVHSSHILHDIVYMWTHCQPSGNPATVIINTMYNSLACRYAFVKATGKPASDFNHFVSMISYGDDNILNIAPEIIPLYNQRTMTEAFATFGMTYTDEQKSGEVAEWRLLSDVSFLKRKFRWHELLHKYVAPLSMVSIMEMTNWNRKSTDLVESTRNGVECALRELYLHSENVFNEWTPKMQKCLLDNGLKPVECLSWRSAQDFLIRGEVDALFPSDSEWV